MAVKMMSEEVNVQKAGVSIIIPVYNEEQAIGNVLEQLNQVMVKSNLQYEILVVNDGSKDSTEKVAKSIEGVNVLNHKTNRGYGAAIKTGARHAHYNLICIIDADGTYPNDRIPELVKILENDFDMVVAARIGDNVEIPLLRKPAKWFINKLANYLAKTKIPDVNSGLRVMRKQIVEKFERILPDGFSFTTTITLAMLTNGYSVKYVPINYFKREGKSKIKPIRDTFNFIQLIIRTVLYFNPLSIFIPLSLFLVMLAFTVLFGSWFFLGRFMDVSFGVILMSAVIVIAIGMLADLIDKRL
ncbi:MAG: glycosyltransferase family 2 protein [Candidatus Scalindua sp.]